MFKSDLALKQSNWQKILEKLEIAKAQKMSKCKVRYLLNFCMSATIDFAFSAI
uniref:hypothetical protein n=1 Tax=Mycoplasmopsis bovis TaxID=28903 RepID=UPI0024B88ADF|nr:hypothetical protein [Mycoplasmopsis bovis]WHL54423.1 hypothetical protein HYE17_04430 [Mycoplasmopsis bovis]